MIPKKIHYMWFGGNPLPESTKKYIESWKKFCPDYEIKQWDETNFDVHSCKYVEEAYNAKKWAFVVDYVRFYVLYNEGGIYVETDTEIIRNIDILRTHNAFFGRAGEDMTLPIIGFVKGAQIGKDMMEIYEKNSFLKADGSYNYKTVNQNLFELLRDSYALDVNETQDIQVLKDDITVYPERYLYSCDSATGMITLNPDLFVIHYADASWLDEENKDSLLLRRKLVKILGIKMGSLTEAFITYIKREGLFSAVKRTIKFMTKKR